MGEVDVVYGCLVREMQLAVDTGTAGVLGERIGRGIVEQLEAMHSAPLARDQLAAMAMQGLLTDRAFPINEAEEVTRLVARAYAVADAMLAEREKGTGRGP